MCEEIPWSYPYSALYSNDLPKNIGQSLVNAYADDTTVYERTSPNLADNRSLL